MRAASSREPRAGKSTIGAGAGAATEVAGASAATAAAAAAAEELRAAAGEGLPAGATLRGCCVGGEGAGVRGYEAAAPFAVEGEAGPRSSGASMSTSLRGTQVVQLASWAAGLAASTAAQHEVRGGADC